MKKTLCALTALAFAAALAVPAFAAGPTAPGAKTVVASAAKDAPHATSSKDVKKHETKSHHKSMKKSHTHAKHKTSKESKKS